MRTLTKSSSVLNPQNPIEHDTCNGDTALREALACVKRRWRVHPMHMYVDGVCTCKLGAECHKHGKHPHLKGWQQEATTNPTDVRKWAIKWPWCNWAIATGIGSGVIVLDVDPQHSGEETLSELQARFGPLPETVTALTGAGYQLYFKHPGAGWYVTTTAGAHGGGVDVRGDDGLAILPGSRHWKGRNYEWDLAHHPDEVAVADLPDLWYDRLSSKAGVTESRESAESSEVNRDYRSHPPNIPPARAISNDSVDSVVSVTTLSVDEIIRITQPNGIGQRNKKLFELARYLRSVPEYANAELNDVRPIVKKWHSLALQHIGTTDFVPSLDDFARAWESVEHPIGKGPLYEAVARADAMNDPPEMPEDYDDRTKCLVKLCIVLQSDALPSPFYISCEVAGQVLGTNKMDTSRRFRQMLRDRLIAVAESHTPTRATRYRYIGRKVEPSARAKAALKQAEHAAELASKGAIK